LAGDLLDEAARRAIGQRLEAFVRRWIERALGPLTTLGRARLTGAARGLAFSLGEALGSVPAAAVADQVCALDARDRAELARYGVRLGRNTIYVQGALRPKAVAARALLWSVAKGHGGHAPVPMAGERWVDMDGQAPDGFYEAIGYIPLARRALRVDLVERAGRELRRALREAGQGFSAPGSVLALTGDEAELDALLARLGLRRGDKARPAQGGRPAARADSPFAKLAGVDFGP
jgi:ATP-dependent RNA helicase SUPV3L1/SUV3